jgi:hemolysin activation/secretion protein
VQGDFAPLDITNKTSTIGFRISHPFVRTPTNTFSMAIGLDHRTSESTLLGVPFPFTAGVPADGNVEIAVVRFSQDWTNRGLSNVIAARSQFSAGIDAFDATINPGNAPSGEFLSWLGQFQWAKLFTNSSQFIFRSNVQLTHDALFSMEQFSVGGALTVRGYRENLLVRDSGYNITLEYRYPVMKDPGGRSILAVAPFFDAGGGDNNVLDNGPNPDFISSAGIGLLWDPTAYIHAELYWGHGFMDDILDDGTNSIQDDGIHFLLSAKVVEW